MPDDGYIDLIASGDERRMKCVLYSALGGAVGGGVGAGIAFAPANAVPVAGTAFNATAAGIGAVLGGLAAGELGLKKCPGDGQDSHFRRMFQQGKIDREAVDSIAEQAASKYDVEGDQARTLANAAVVYKYHYGTPDVKSSEVQRTNAVGLLLSKMGGGKGDETA